MYDLNNLTKDKTNYNNSLNLSQNWRRIKQFARFDLIQFTEHAEEAIKNRQISKDDVMHLLKSANSTIVQHHEVGTYNDNKSPIDVIFGKIRYGKKQILHVVLATETTTSGGFIIKVVTVYQPSKDIFEASGRVLKRK